MMRRRERLALPVFKIVKVFWDEAPTCVLSSFSAVADRLMAGPDGETPVPVSATAEGLPVALWATDKEADLAPTDEGVKVTVKV